MNKKQDRVNRLMPGGIPRWVRCYDNGGETCDRYTVVFTGKYKKGRDREFMYLGMSEKPFHPQGFGQRGETRWKPCDVNEAGFAPAIGRSNHLGKRIQFDELPHDCKVATISDYRQLWYL